MKQDFLEWYKETEKENGSLVTPATAARLLEISTQHLNRIIELGRVKKHYYDKIPYIGMNDIDQEMEHRKQKSDIDEDEIKEIAKMLDDSKASKADMLIEAMKIMIKHAGRAGMRVQKAIVKATKESGKIDFKKIMEIANEERNKHENIMVEELNLTAKNKAKKALKKKAV
jgi:hypothetical protein